MPKFSAERDRQYLPRFGGNGIEIGGPSEFFREGKGFSIYSVAAGLDNVNYSTKTLWEAEIREGRNFKYAQHKAPGQQFIAEATDLASIPDGTYDFVASCHTLEHCANPLQALREWRRILKDDGWLVLVLPHKAGTFDHRRKVTEFEHLLEDYHGGVGEEDSTHFSEILEKYDLRRDPGQRSQEDFEDWIHNNAVNRGAHHHVFDPTLAATLVDYAGFKLSALEAVLPFHIFIVAQKSRRGSDEKRKELLQLLRICNVRSPFKSDRKRPVPNLPNCGWVTTLNRLDSPRLHFPGEKRI
jgi:SAM-dependent methyltransferase